MSSLINNLEVLHFNPIILSRLFVSFYEELGPKSKSLLLSYLLLPIIMNLECRRFLKNANKSSSIRTLLADRGRIFGLHERVGNLKTLSNKSVQYAFSAKYLFLADDLNVCIGRVDCDSIPTNRDIDRAVRRLGIMFSDHDVVSVYRLLGVKAL